MRKFEKSMPFLGGYIGLPNFWRLCLVVVFLCAMSACHDKNAKDIDLGSPSKKVSVPKIDFSTLSKDDYFEISKDGCMSGCPYFKMRINGKGTFEFQDFWYGKDRAPTRGELSQENTKKLFQEIEKFGLEDFSDSKMECRLFKSDQTTERMQLAITKRIYNIEYNMGCIGFENESKLHQFEDQINSILELDKLSEHRQ